MEKPVTFRNVNNQTLFGILHIPEPNLRLEPRIGINLLNPGLKNRVAPNRLNVKIARFLCEKGFFVLRFDPHGVGDSEGSLPNKHLLDLWGDIQKEEFVEDTISANEYFCSACGVRELVLIGGCGGAITAFFAAVKDDRVKKLLLIDMPVIISNSGRSFKDMVISTDETSKQFLMMYIRKALTHPKSWLNFVSGRSEYNAIWALLRKKVGLRALSEENESYVERNFNKSIPLALKKLISGKVQISFFLAERDGNTAIFKDKLERPYLLNNSDTRELCDVTIIRSANHIYALEEAQNILLEYIVKRMPGGNSSNG